MTAHVCQDCGMLHDAPVATETPEVQIARIQAESAFKIAQLQARADKAVAEMETEASVDVAEAQAEAIVVALSAEEEAPSEEALEPEAESAPVVISTPIIDSGNDEVPEPPKRNEVEHQDHEPKKPKGLGLW